MDGTVVLLRTALVAMDDVFSAGDAYMAVNAAQGAREVMRSSGCRAIVVLLGLEDGILHASGNHPAVHEVHVRVLRSETGAAGCTTTCR